MGGRAAEELIFQTSTSSAQDDLKQVSKLSRKMVLHWGMSERFQHISLGSNEEEVQKITNEAFKRAINTLKDHRDVLEQVADLLLEKEEISGSEVERLFEAKN